MAKTISLINGPNLNLLGKRKPEIYGSHTLSEITKTLEARALQAGYTLNAYQSNSEGELVDAIQKAGIDAVGMIINPAAYSHTSVAIRDALESMTIPVIEVHLSNIYAREPFRRHSLISEVVLGCVVGLGAEGYSLALEALLKRF